MSSSSSFSSPSSSSSCIGEENGENPPPPTSMLFRFHQLEKRITIATTTTTTTTQLRNVPSISDIVGCDITINDIQLAKQELINQKFDLKKDVNERQKSPTGWCRTPMIQCCESGNLLIVRLLFLIDADCTKLYSNGYRFPMLAAADSDHLEICKWLFKYGGDAKYQINKQTSWGSTPLQQSHIAWRSGRDKEGKTCRWLLRNGGGQHLSPKAMSLLRIKGKEETNSNLLVLWMREHMQLYDIFLLFLCGATNMIATSSLESNGGTRKRKRKPTRERSLQILDGHPGIMEVIGNYIGLIRGKEFRMLTEFNESVIAYNNTYHSSTRSDEADDDDDDDESRSDDDNCNDNDNSDDEE